MCMQTYMHTHALAIQPKAKLHGMMDTHHDPLTGHDEQQTVGAQDLLLGWQHIAGGGLVGGDNKLHGRQRQEQGDHHACKEDRGKGGMVGW